MQKIFISIFAVLIGYILFLVGVLGLFPLVIAVPLFFISILISVHFLNERGRFKGFSSSRLKR
ncbi:hypothetical protein [Natribacillus halophilus]|uniref:Uncharacterized protein n=1 Tax=Natribacillus halophilus TaxID=549003 RepID=A0A1G8LFS3_9BACI|nr:hypothetical protein [Natribacillus halophilus]SDI54475.1 hypothetical protein SAMN04488123_10366 [Natribacillus halophilus]